ncbi:MAG: AMP nucleosidase [Desulfobulbaceae bacterium]|nr:AMP nucleosidase [Desulfobulbaceae bacterium]
MSSLLRPDNYARHTLERYTGSPVTEFCSHILICNFHRYIRYFSTLTGKQIFSNNWSVVHDHDADISMINYGVGSPQAGIVMHCLSFLDELKCVLMLGMCGGIDDTLEIGDLILPTASIRDEGTSAHYLPKDVPALPTFGMNRIAEEVMQKEFNTVPKSGIMHTTDYRMWEFDKEFIDYILKHRIIAIDMEIATLFSVGYALNVPTGALMLVSDLPLKKGGIKSKDSAQDIFQTYTERHLETGIKIVEEIQKQNCPIR